MLIHGGQALRGEAALLLATLRDRRLALLLALFAALLALAAQAPLRYRIEVGREDGPGSDLPLVAGFWPVERDAHGDFRWTTRRALIRLPGVGQRPLEVTLAVFPVNEEVSRRGPRDIELWAGGRLLGHLPVRQAGALYHVLLPPPADRSGDQVLELRSATFIPTGDQRAIGVPVDAIAAAGAGPALPAWRGTLAWLGAALLAWLALRRAGFGPWAALTLLLPGLLLAGLAALLDPPRFALGGGPALAALALGWLLVLALAAAPAALLLAGLVLAPLAGAELVSPRGTILPGVAAALLLAGAARPTVAALGRRLGATIAPGAWRWLVLMALLVFATRYGGKIYPDSMPGDIGFHINRFNDTVRGNVLLLSRNRGVDFPYPPALYLLLAPFSLLGLDQRVLLQLGGALLDALSPFLVYLIGAQIPNPKSQAPNPKSQAPSPKPQVPSPKSQAPNRTALLAAGIYSFSAAGLMTTWWNFSTHIFAQFAHLLLIAALVLLWRRATTDHRPPTTDRPTEDSPSADHPPIAEDRPAWPEDRGLKIEDSGVAAPEMRSSILHPPSSILGGLVVLQALVYLGHFGFWINMTLLGAIGLAALLLAALRGGAPWALFRLLLGAFLVAEGFAALCFYSGYTELFLAQIAAARQGGLTGLAGRGAADLGLLWRTLWDAGFRVHFGFFPLPLAVCGLLLLLRPPTTDDRPPLRRRSGQATTDHRLPAHGTRSATHPSTQVSRFTFHVSRFTFHAAPVVLMAGTFAIALLFASLPFLSGSTLSTRWLMFSAWAIAVGAAVAAQALWRAGRAGRLLVLAAGGYMVWVTASMWLAALAWRVRPPEPF